MYTRLEPFINEKIYHVFTKTIDSRNIFSNEKHCNRFLNILYYYRSRKALYSLSFLPRLNKDIFNRLMSEVAKKIYFKVEILTYCLMPTHFHLLLKQKQECGISKYMADTLNSFTRYYNQLNERKGPLFLPKFKSTMITSDEELKHVSRYIHLNSVSSQIVSIDNLISYPWSSFPSYVSEIKNLLSDNSEVMELFNFDKKRYKEFVESNAQHQITLEYLKRHEK